MCLCVCLSVCLLYIKCVYVRVCLQVCKYKMCVSTSCVHVRNVCARIPVDVYVCTGVLESSAVDIKNLQICVLIHWSLKISGAISSFPSHVSGACTTLCSRQISPTGECSTSH
jgi:hypothetical protein